ncbi:MAG TPA: hypothetical protein VGI76_08255 [Solirubrobacteraceae bacterium]|jgi:hypothetical protein
MRLPKLTQIVLALAALALWPSQAASATAPTVTLHAALTPEQLGHGTTMKFGFSISFSAGQSPVALRELHLRYPANLGLATSGLGVSNCRVAVLEADGPPGCPRNSVMGYGSALVEVPLGSEILYERVRATTFMAPLQDGHLALLFYANGESPVAAELVFPALVLPASAPFGGDLSTRLPLIPSIPDAPDVAILQLNTTIGPSGVTYDEYAKGRTIPYRPRGILLPHHCPHDAFQFAGQFAFNDGTTAEAHTVVPCPRTRHLPMRR